MTRFLTGAFVVSLLTIALHLYGEKLLGRILARGDSNVWGDVCKQPEYRYFNGGKP